MDQERALLLMPNISLFEKKRENWPPPPKVKQWDDDGFEKPRTENLEITELKKRNENTVLHNLHGSDDSINNNNSPTVDFIGSGPFHSRLSNVPKIPEASKSSIMSITSKHESRTFGQSFGVTDEETFEVKKFGQKIQRQKPIVDEVMKQKKKVATRQIPRMSRLILWDYLKTWDKSSNPQRIGLILKFLEDYTSLDPLDLEYYLSRGGSLILTRFLVGMQISYQLKKSVAHHFMALGIFIKSLAGERYTYEFALAGGFLTTFEVLRVHEMTNHDKMHIFHFLQMIIDGKGGCSAKRFLCSDSSYLECVVDCLTMCQNEHVIQEAKLFLENLCIGNTSKNLVMISKYIISLLPCDFNPRIQSMACCVLIGIINQNPDVAGSCCTLVVDVLKSDYDDSLIDVGNVCIAIMSTPTADELLFNLIEVVQPYNLLDNLTISDAMLHADVESNAFTISETSSLKSDIEGSQTSQPIRVKETIVPEHDAYFRLQYGAIYVLSYLVKNRTEFADWMIERGVIGSLLSAIGTACYTSVQLEAIRLLLLLHELSPDCTVALPFLFPKQLLAALLNEREELLQYVTAVMCLVLRQLGSKVQENWTAWFRQVALPGASRVIQPSNIKEDIATEQPEAEGEATEENLTDAIEEIDSLVELLEETLNDPFMTIAETMKLIFPNSNVIDMYRESPITRRSSRLTLRTQQEKFTPAEQHIQETDDLEPFRKYLRKDNINIQRADEFEKYYAAKFIMDSEADSVDMDAMQVAALQDAEEAMKTFKDPFKAGLSLETEDTNQDITLGRDSFEETESGHMLNL